MPVIKPAYFVLVDAKDMTKRDLFLSIRYSLFPFPQAGVVWTGLI